MDRLVCWLVELPRVVVDQVILWNNVFVDVGGEGIEGGQVCWLVELPSVVVAQAILSAATMDSVLVLGTSPSACAMLASLGTTAHCSFVLVPLHVAHMVRPTFLFPSSST